MGEALSELITLEDDDEWKVDASVYNAASHVAVALKASMLPAPRVFTHGPHSVVFNWSNAFNNLYLTISANRISALLSSPERILRRVEYSTYESLNPADLVVPYDPSYLMPPAILISESDTEPREPVG